LGGGCGFPAPPGPWPGGGGGGGGGGPVYSGWTEGWKDPIGRRRTLRRRRTAPALTHGSGRPAPRALALAFWKLRGKLTSGGGGVAEGEVLEGGRERRSGPCRSSLKPVPFFFRFSPPTYPPSRPRRGRREGGEGGSGWFAVPGGLPWCSGCGGDRGSGGEGGWFRTRQRAAADTHRPPTHRRPTRPLAPTYLGTRGKYPGKTAVMRYQALKPPPPRESPMCPCHFLFFPFFPPPGLAPKAVRAREPTPRLAGIYVAFF
jgi:hypothetical protein